MKETYLTVFDENSKYTLKPVFMCINQNSVNKYTSADQSITLPDLEY